MILNGNSFKKDIKNVAPITIGKFSKQIIRIPKARFIIMGNCCLFRTFSRKLIAFPIQVTGCPMSIKSLLGHPIRISINSARMIIAGIDE